MFKILVVISVFINVSFAGGPSYTPSSSVSRRPLISPSESHSFILPCQYEIDSELATESMLNAVIAWLNSNTFTTIAEYSEQLSNAFNSERSSDWFVELLGELASKSSNLDACKLNGTQIRFL